MKSLSFVFYIFITMGIIWFSLFLMSHFFLGINNCNENSEAVAYARNLSNERLGRLYASMMNYSQSVDTSVIGYGNDSYLPELPPEFQDIKAIRVDPVRGDILLAGCFDEFVHLWFKNLDGDGQPKIELTWGAAPGENRREIIWQEN